MQAESTTIDERALVRKISLRIIPAVFILYIISYIDRANIGYAALQMNKELALSSEAFGFVSGVFFIGYFMFEVPSNMMLARFGARIWIARILVTWGLFAACSAFVESANQLYVLRFLLGASEAGFFPGIILYLTYWFRAKERATTVALFTSAIPVSYVVGAPLSTWVMDHVHWFGWSGWRCMLMLEGGPAILAGIACFCFLPDKPERAKWLSASEKAWLQTQLIAEAKDSRQSEKSGPFRAIVDRKVLHLAFIYFVYQCGSLGVGYWMPQIIQGFSAHLSKTQIGLIATIPYIIATVSMVLWSRHSDRRDERKYHAAAPLGIAAIALVLAGFSENPYVSILLISMSLAGLYSFKSPFWALPTLFLPRTTAAVSIAVINSVGNLGGFVGPFAIGIIKGRHPSAAGGLIFLAGLLVVSCVMTVILRLNPEDSGDAGRDTSLNKATS